MRLVTFGEAMVRLSPPSGSALEKAEHYSVDIAGSEANLAIALARLGWSTRWVSRLPRNALGRRIANQIREHGVDVSLVSWTDEGRAGLYFVEPALPPRSAQVIYDRAGSSLALLGPDDLDSRLLEGMDCLHLTGITPALSAGCTKATEWLLSAATDRGMSVSFDVNYRARLWSSEDAKEVLSRFLGRVQVLFVRSVDAALLFGAEGEPAHQAKALCQRWPEATIVVTAGEQGAWAWDGQLHHRPAVQSADVDPIGSGDAFAGGFLYGQAEQGVDFGLACGVALAAIARTYSGDIVWCTEEDLLAVVNQASGDFYR